MMEGFIDIFSPLPGPPQPPGLVRFFPEEKNNKMRSHQKLQQKHNMFKYNVLHFFKTKINPSPTEEKTSSTPEVGEVVFEPDNDLFPEACGDFC
jgi:hypothetical protein